MLTNRVQALMDSPAVALAQVKDGKLRALATTLPRRSPLLPDVPTMHEVGVTKFSISNWMGLIGPANLPREIVDRLNREFGTALRNPATACGITSIKPTQGLVPWATVVPPQAGVAARAEVG